MAAGCNEDRSELRTDMRPHIAGRLLSRRWQYRTGRPVSLRRTSGETREKSCFWVACDGESAVAEDRRAPRHGQRRRGRGGAPAVGHEEREERALGGGGRVVAYMGDTVDDAWAGHGYIGLRNHGSYSHGRYSYGLHSRRPACGMYRYGPYSYGPSKHTGSNCGLVFFCFLATTLERRKTTSNLARAWDISYGMVSNSMV